MDIMAFLSSRAEPMISIRSLSGDYEFVNDRVCEVTRRRVDQYIGTDWRQFCAPENIQYITDVTRRVVQTGQRDINVFKYPMESGSHISVITNYSLIQSKQAKLLHCEAYLLEENHGLVPASSARQDDDLEAIIENLAVVSRLAKGRGLSVLRYLVDVCKLEATSHLEQRLSRLRH